MSRPVILVTGPDGGGTAMWYFLHIAVWRAGGRAVRITPKRNDRIPPYDALLLSGGADVDPDLYGGDPDHLMEQMLAAERGSWRRWLAYVFLPVIWLARLGFSLRTTTGEDPDRDELEFAVLAQAWRNRRPVLGICRGAQLMNVFRGGTLHQDLRDFYTEVPRIRSVMPRKDIRIRPGSELARLCGEQPMRVNSLHDQAIDRLGENLVVSAVDAGRVVQAIEDPEHPFFIGVQWHPEFLPHRTRQTALFEAFVKAARHASLTPETSPHPASTSRP